MEGTTPSSDMTAKRKNDPVPVRMPAGIAMHTVYESGLWWLTD